MATEREREIEIETERHRETETGTHKEGKERERKGERGERDWTKLVSTWSWICPTMCVVVRGHFCQTLPSTLFETRCVV